MSSMSLAPSNNNARHLYKQSGRAVGAVVDTSPIQSSKPCAQVPSHPDHWRHFVTDWPRDSCYNNNPQYHDTTEFRSASISSSGSGSVVTPMSSIDLEKHRNKAAKGKASRQHDPEKAMGQSRSNGNLSVLPNDSASVAFSEEEEEGTSRRSQEHKALKILLFLSGPCVMLSSLNTAWACISLVITMLTQPIRLCARRPSFGQQLAGLLGPTLNLQLRCIYTPLPPHANEDGSYHAFMLVAVHMLSPLLSLGMMLVAWVVAVFWISSMVVGDPAGTDKRDDGRETVLTLRNWWECWQTKGVKEI